MKLILCSCILFLAVGQARAQGIQPVTQETLELAKKIGTGRRPRDVLFVNSPLMRRQVTLDTPSYRPEPNERLKFIQATKQVPFRFTIVSPFVRAAVLVAEASRRYQETTLHVQELNAGLVTIHVEPSTTITNAEAIDDVVIKRGGVVIRPSKKDVRPTTLQTLAGATRELAEGDFTFDFGTFVPDAEITIVLIGRAVNFEWTVRPGELDQLK
jgi:hypothetical protein